MASHRGLVQIEVEIMLGFFLARFLCNPMDLPYNRKGFGEKNSMTL
jgi:hypothetical protein